MNDIVAARHTMQIGDRFHMYRMCNALEGNGVVEEIGPETNPVYKIRVYQGYTDTGRYMYFRASLTKEGIKNEAYVHVERNRESGRWNADKDCYGTKN